MLRQGLRGLALLPVAIAVLACGDASVDPSGGGPAAGGAAAEGGGAPQGGAGGNGAPAFDDDERAIIASLSPATLPSAPPDSTNAYADDPDAAVLGRALFFTPLFAGPLLDGDNNGEPNTLGLKGETGKVACAGCHLPTSDFSDTRSPSAQISLAAGWGRRRAPSLLDVGQAKLVTWDGRRDTLYNQVFGPFESLVEMNSSRLYVAERVFATFRAPYEAVFGPMPPLDDEARFPPLSAEMTGCQPATDVSQPAHCDGTWHGYPGDGAEYDSMTPEDQEAVTRVVVNVGKAIGAYERLLTCGPSRFDAWAQGDASALSVEEQRGLKLFIGKAKCVDCHGGPFLSDQAFHNVGLTPAQVASAFYDLDDAGASAGIAQALEDPLNASGVFSDGDDGRLPDAIDPALEGSFRTPMLRCVARRPSFMHTGQMKALAAVVDHFNRGGNEAGYPGTNELAPLDLDEGERGDLVAFLRALDGPGAAAELLAPP